MEQLQTSQPSQVIPIEVQVYQQELQTGKIQNSHIIHISDQSLQTTQGTITYQQTGQRHVSVSSEIHNYQSQMTTLQSCSQDILPTHSVHTMQPMEMQSQNLQPLQITQQLILPVFKSHVVMNTVPHTQQYFGQFGYEKGQQRCIVPKLEPDVRIPAVLKDKEYSADDQPQSSSEETVSKKPNPQSKRIRRPVPDPEKWACNVRKLKHQRGEAYINRRGKFVPERQVKNTKDCLKTCKLKCNEYVSDSDREHIFKAFYSLTTNEKKLFLLNTTERTLARKKRKEDTRRKYTFKYFFIVQSTRYTVCKNFYLGTLAISQKPVYNVHLGKSVVPKRDGRGLAPTSTQGISAELKDKVRQHIMSFSTIDSKDIVRFSRKKQYLYHNISVKQMYEMYLTECNKEEVGCVKESMYRKIFKKEFNLDFKKVKLESQVLCAKCKEPVKKK